MSIEFSPCASLLCELLYADADFPFGQREVLVMSIASLFSSTCSFGGKDIWSEAALGNEYRWGLCYFSTIRIRDCSFTAGQWRW